LNKIYLFIFKSENDNKPEFERSEINLKFNENILGGYQIPFLGAKDIDEGENSEIRYILNGLKEDLLLFELIILSKSFSSINFDQLALKYTPRSLLTNKSEFQLIVYAINFNLNNSMKINIKIEKSLNNKIEFSSSEYKFILINNQIQIGFVKIKSENENKNILYKIQNKTNENIQINSLTGELTFINSSLNFNLNEINLIIEAFYLQNEKNKIFTKVKILFRLTKKFKEIRFEFNLISSLIQQVEKNSFLINQNIRSNEVLFQLSINSSYYPDDQYFIFLDNYLTTFSLLSSSSSLNKYLLKLNNNPPPSKSIYYLRIRIKHKLTNEWLNNLIIKLHFLDENSTTELCIENRIFILQDFNQNFIAKFKVNKTILNISSFSTFSIDQDQILIDHCQMFIIEQLNQHFNSSEYQLCSLNHLCYNLTFIQPQSQPRPQYQRSSNKHILFKPIEITIFAFSLVFILATLTLFIIICRLKGIHLCLNIKNYLFYGKKYGLSNAQRLSSNKITVNLPFLFIEILFSYLFSKEFIRLLLENLNHLQYN
jgi:hypothetical protein